MNKKQTLFEQRTAMKALRHERLSQGLCQECGENPRTMNLDNTKSVHCQPCKDAKQRAAWNSTHGPGKRPPSTDEWGMVDDFGYLDTPEFYEYCETVKGVIYATALFDAISRPFFCFTVRPFFAPAIGDQRRALKDGFVDRMHQDALDYLMASGEIRERASGSLTRYEPSQRHDRNTIPFGGRTLMLPGSLRSPIEPLFEDRMAA